MEKKLIESVGKLVRVVNWSSEEMEKDKVQIHAHGKLERDEDDGSFYVRIGENPEGHGCNGITFFAANVSECFRQPSGITTIVLKG
jgi:hypothetical protein